MSTVHLTTIIHAPVERVFDLSRSIDLHRISTVHTREQAIAGVTTGLINENERVTWQAQHLFKLRRFTSLITKMEKPVGFTDQMIEGDFKAFKHEHRFKTINEGTLMIDLVNFQSPYAFVGRLFNKVYLTGYLKALLEKRNETIKEYAETEKWKVILN